MSDSVIKYLRSLLLAIFVSAGLGSVALAQSSCPLSARHPYKSPSDNSVYYVSDSCTKRPIKNPDVYFSHFTSWIDVDTVSADVIASIPDDPLSFLPWGTRRTFDNGSLIKTVTDPDVYIRLDDQVYPIGSETAFRDLGYDFSQIEDVVPEVFESYRVGSRINGIGDYPGSLVFKYAGDPDVFILERNSSGYYKRRISSFDDVKRDYREDRIAVLPSSQQIFDSPRGSVGRGVSLKNISGGADTVVSVPSTGSTSNSGSGGSSSQSGSSSGGGSAGGSGSSGGGSPSGSSSGSGSAPIDSGSSSSGGSATPSFAAHTSLNAYFIGHSGVNSALPVYTALQSNTNATLTQAHCQVAGRIDLSSHFDSGAGGCDDRLPSSVGSSGNDIFATRANYGDIYVQGTTPASYDAVLVAEHSGVVDWLNTAILAGDSSIFDTYDRDAKSEYDLGHTCQSSIANQPSQTWMGPRWLQYTHDLSQCGPQVDQSGGRVPRFYLYNYWYDEMTSADYTDPASYPAKLRAQTQSWQQVVNTINRPNIRFVPSAEGLARLMESMAPGASNPAPGFETTQTNSAAELISSNLLLHGDNIHLTNVGYYFVSLVAYATMMERSPVGLPLSARHDFEIFPEPAGYMGGVVECASVTTDMPNAGAPICITSALRQHMQEIAWQVAQEQIRCDQYRRGESSDSSACTSVGFRLAGSSSVDAGSDTGSSDTVVVTPDPTPDPTPTPDPDPTPTNPSSGNNVSNGTRPDPSQFRLGLNLQGTEYFTTNWRFANAMKHAGVAVESHPGGMWFATHNDVQLDNNSRQLLDLDQHGYVRSMTLTDGRRLDSVHALILAAELPNSFPAGDYDVYYDGEGSLTFEIHGATGQTIDHGAGRMTLRINEYSGELLVMVRITETDPNSTGNYLRNIQVIRPGQSRDDLFHTAYISEITPFSVIRGIHFAGDAEIYGSGLPWSQRKTLDSAHYGGRYGGPIEAMSLLANETNSDQWVNVPINADDSYVRNMANAVYDTLDSRLNVYVELGNELWNGAPPYSEGQAYAAAQGRARWNNISGEETQDYHVALNWLGARSVEVCNIWRGVFGTDRVICVMAGQAGWDYPGQQVLDCPINVANGGSRCGDEADAFAIGPYVQEDAYDGITFSRASAEAYISDAITHMNGPFRDSLVANKSLADRYNIPLIAYEGGQHFYGSTFTQEVNTHANMGTLYDNLFRIWEEIGGGLFVHFTETHAPSEFNYEAFGYKPYQYSTRANAPKYDALLRTMERIGQL